MIKDFHETIQIFQHSSYSNLKLLENRIQTAINLGKLSITTDLFWASSSHFCEMSKSLSEELSMYDLIILKGDVNYRRLLSDRDWPYTASIEEIIKYFPASTLILRTLKSQIMVNLKEIQVKKMFLLWEIMVELEILLWEIYYEEFMELCIERTPDPGNDITNNDFPF